VPALNEFLELSRAHSSQLMGLSYGIPALDAFTEGMKGGEVTVVGARSGVGKSVEMLQAARANCREGIPVHIFSLEMTRKQCLNILWAMESGVPFKKIRKPSRAMEDEVDAVKSAALRVAEWPLRIHDKTDMDLSQIAALARLSIRHNGTRIICVDYAQNVEAEGKDERAKVSKVSRTLTKLAKDEGNHLMLLSQLRKVPAEMYSKPPTVADLRETGQLENDAHIVLLFHRAWDEERARIADAAEILIPKQRSGDTGVIQANFNRHTMMFE
jgi:replicative DNA helicase